MGRKMKTPPRYGTERNATMKTEIKIVNLTEVTNTVRIADKEFVLFSFELSELPNELKELGYQKKMYGTIEKSEVENGIIKAGRNLGYFARGNTVAEALESRIDRVMTAGKSLEEILAYYKAKNEKKVG